MEFRQHPHFSSSQRKQPTTPKPRGYMNTNDPINPNFIKYGQVESPRQVHQPPFTQQYRKQVRRRVNNRPYQDRLLNMAEARKEIANALKCHRASMRQASNKEQQQQPQHLSNFEQGERFKTWTNVKMYPSCTTNFSNYLGGFSNSYSYPHAPPSVPNSFTTPVTPHPPFPTPLVENPNVTFPSHTTIVNLLSGGINNSEPSFFHNNINNSSLSSSFPPPVLTDEPIPLIGTQQEKGVSSVVDTDGSTNGCFHTAMDEEGIAEMNALGDQFQMELNDAVSVVTSTQWLNFFKNMETAQLDNNNEDVTHHYIFDELMEFPVSLSNTNKSCLEQCSEDCLLDPMFLPW